MEAPPGDADEEQHPAKGDGSHEGDGSGDDGGEEDSDTGENDEAQVEAQQGPPPALSVVYSRGDRDKFLLTMGGWARGVIFECSWQVQTKVALKGARRVR